jgi:hypothetical protein
MLMRQRSREAIIEACRDLLQSKRGRLVAGAVFARETRSEAYGAG